MKKLYVNGNIVATGNYVVEEVDEQPKYYVKVVYDSDYEMDKNNYWNEQIKFYSNHRCFSFDGKVDDEIIENLKKKEVGFDKYYPVYAYEHSGFVLYTSPYTGPDACWDSGLFGVAKVDNSYGDADSLFENFFSELKAVMEGEVYGFKIVDELGDVVDSCYGFYGEKDDIIGSMFDCISKEYGITREDVKEALENAEY